ncbi:unnamed protein product [Rotaria sp. Silwood2]|nr:unnamed protein product [Rotaria sp. Silwood2]CAF3211077.1 unnamed protein product [Rotaria sp. Silwood2]CAF4148741.1 unnamed protein product [Rotaria sp. Silwood2]
MRQQYGFVFFLLLFISKYHAQNPTTTSPLEWNGDPKLCTVNPSAAPSTIPGPPLPKFSNKAEFALERVEIKHLLNVSLPTVITMYQQIYDYDANKLIVVKNENGFISVEYYYYDILKKSTYYRGDFCVVTNIPTENDMDSASAVKLNGTWHIRPMNEFMLFSNENPNRPIVRPIYLGQDIVRGIPVDKWQTCYIKKETYQTMRRRWAFAQQGVAMPGSTIENYAIPVQALVSASVVFPNGTQAFEVDEVFNVLSFRPGIMETTDALEPPKGVFCASGPDQTLVSLKDIGVSWPNRFSVRVDTSTSRSSRWQRFHLRYDLGRDGGSRRLRYDFMPSGSEDFQSIIHDYSDNLTYIIDQRVGSCKINAGVYIPDVNFIYDPIRFFVKHEAHFIFNPPENAWESNGFRSCRGNTIKCAILTTSIDNFPPMVDLDTGASTGETWLATNIEYGWSMRAPYARPPSDQPKQFDYPVSLYLKVYRFRDPNNPSPSNILTQDIEYEFYEMSHDLKLSDFDTSICYRSLNLDYLHLGFVLKPSTDNLVDGNHLDRRALERNVAFALMTSMQVTMKHLSNIELDHIQFDNSVYVLFTLLGPVPLSENNEPSAETSRQRLEIAINTGQFTFNMTLLDYDRSQVVFSAQPNSLKVSKQFMSIHASVGYTNVSICNISKANASICEVPKVNNSHTNGQRIKQEKYTSAAQAGAIIGGLIVGIVLGLIAIIAVQLLDKKLAPDVSSSVSGGFKSINSDRTKPETPLTMQNLQAAVDTSHA